MKISCNGFQVTEQTQFCDGQTDSIHVISLKRASVRFCFHVREVFQKCIEHIGKFLIQIREISKFW